jgi:hypothetical protein
MENSNTKPPVTLPEEFIIRIFSNKNTRGYVPELKRVTEVKVDNDVYDLANRAMISINKFAGMEQYKHCLIVAGNPRSNGAASDVAFRIRDDVCEAHGLEAKQVDYVDKYENNLFGMEFTKIEVE